MNWDVTIQILPRLLSTLAILTLWNPLLRIEFQSIIFAPVSMNGDTWNLSRRLETSLLESPHSRSLWCAAFFFFTLSERTADGNRKGSHKDRSPNLMRLPTENDHLAHVVKPLKGQCSNQTAWAHKQRSEAGVLRCAGVNPERLQTLRD